MYGIFGVRDVAVRVEVRAGYVGIIQARSERESCR